MAKVDLSIQQLHQEFADKPLRKMKVRRQSDNGSCVLSSTFTGNPRTTTTAAGDPDCGSHIGQIPCSTTTSISGTTSTSPAITAPPTPSCVPHNEDPDQGINQAFCLCDNSITLSPLPATSAQSESCAYKSIPTATRAQEVVTTLIQSWTFNCQACTIVGGIADQETCTPVAGCTPTATPTPQIAAWVANMSTIDIGNAEDENGGKDLATGLFTKLKGMCANSICNGDHAEMDNVEVVLADGEEPLKPAMYIQDAA